MWPNPQETADLVTYTDKILNGKCKCKFLMIRTIKELVVDNIPIVKIGLISKYIVPN